MNDVNCGSNATQRPCLIPHSAGYLELHSRYWGGNNGKLSLSLEEGARLLGLGKATVKRALEELEDKGFVAMTRRGHFYGRRASEYRLTGQPTDRNTTTRDWENRTPDGPKNSELGSDTDPSVVVMGPFQNRRVADGCRSARKNDPLSGEIGVQI